jgi:bifunctional non-homologous end joining protein LigD
MPLKKQRKPSPKKQPKPSGALDRYLAKRDWKFTSEPEAKVQPVGGNSFVVQEHHARNLHYDLRLELDGVMKSWAVPKGPSMDPEMKRLAVEVEDHPVDYNTFEGIIPKGQYGAGEVKIWDSGTWEPVDQKPDARDAFNEGHIKFRLFGNRLKGDFVLIRTSKADDEKRNWLLRKIDDEPVEETGGSEPMDLQLSKLYESVPTGKDWLHEIKYDGYRVTALKEKGKVKLITRGGHDWTEKFGDMADRLSELPAKDFRLDGEIVVFDEKGRTSFGLLQDALTTRHPTSCVFIAFDILRLHGKSVADEPLLKRKELLRAFIPGENKRVIYSEHWVGQKAGEQLFKQACEMGIEGIMSKPVNDRYLFGSRQGWRKIKCTARQEFVICGYTPPKNSCPGFGALIMGSFEGGDLIYRGKVGTGFSDDKRRELLEDFQKYIISKSPFSGKTAVDRSAIWLKPVLVAEVKFSELTGDGSIRHGSFIGLRMDKKPTKVKLEAAKPVGVSEIAGVKITHPERIIFPEKEITKLEVAEYYERISGVMLPYVIRRPLSFLRAPSGIEGEIFFQKHFPMKLPKSVKEKILPDEKDSVCYINDLTGLIALVQFGVVEIHIWGSKLTSATKPDQLIWDLDPEETVPWEEVLGTAFLLRDILTEIGLNPVVKTSGGKGLHIVVFCKPKHEWDVMKPFTKAVAELLVSKNPKKLTVQISKSKRTGKIFIDWLRNGRGATCVAPWCLRARKSALVSTPMNWSDLPNVKSEDFTIETVKAKNPSEWIEAVAKPNVIPISLVRQVMKGE